MKTKLNSLLQTPSHTFVKLLWVGTILFLIATRAEAQNLFVATYGNGQINAFTPTGSLSTFATGLNQPLGLAFDRAGNLYEADANSGNIYKFTPAGVPSTFATGLNRPVGLAFDSAGNLYEADDTSGNINKFTPAGVQSTFASGLNSPVGLAFNSAGDLFEGDFGSGNIYEFTPAAAKSTFATGLSQPAFLAFQPATLVINCPGDIITNNAPGQCSATVAFAATATGSPPPTIVYTLDGSAITSPFPFPVGTNVVTCIASNLTGSTSCSFTVLVRDVVPPMIDCPSNIVVDALSPNGAVVIFTVTASDQCAPSPQVTSVPPSGSLFALGQTTVVCTAVDAWGNSNQCSFLISVRASQVESSLTNLINYLAGLPIQHGVKNALLVKLKNALSELQHGQITYALDLLTAFEHQVAAQTGKKLTLTQAAALTSGANAIIASLTGLAPAVPSKANTYSARVSLQMVPTAGSDGASCILKVNWTGSGVLQSATRLNGRWTDVPMAVTPYWSEVGVTQQFFRVRTP